MHRNAQLSGKVSSPERGIDDLLASVNTGFSCKMCGSCCALDVQITESDLMRIESRFPAQVAKVNRLRERGPEQDGKLYSTLFADASGKVRCIFLEGNRCSVHEAKPLQCRLYPFFPIQINSVQSLVSSSDDLIFAVSLTGKRYVVSVNQDCAGVHTSPPSLDWRDLVLLWEQHEMECEEATR